MRVFVATELHPFTAGGIGRVLANLIEEMSADERADTCVVLQRDDIDESRVTRLYPGIRVVVARTADYRTMGDDGRRYPPAWAFTDTEWHWRSVLVMQTLADLEAKAGPLGYIEFPDWGGLGYATLQERLLGTAFVGSTIAVRLHSASAVIAAHESVAQNLRSLALADIERKCVADCDILVSQLQGVGDRMRVEYGFTPEQWDPRVVLAAPPVVLDEGAPQTQSIVVTDDTDIVFSSKIQSIKQPVLFARACVGFMRRRPSWRGSVVFCAHTPSQEAVDDVIKRVPPDLRGRFRFDAKLSQRERAALISTSVAVTSSSWESFCLSAYEASLGGAVCVVNAANPAFAPGSPWVDGENCLTFDGSLDSLVDALGRAFERTAPLAVAHAPKASRAHERVSATAPAEVPDSLPLLSVIVPHFNLGTYVLRTIDSVLASDYPNVEVLVVDDASTDTDARLVIEKLEVARIPRVRVVRSAYNRGLSGARNLGLSEASGEYVLTIDADDLISPTFARTAIRALEANPAFDFVVPQTAFFSDEDESSAMTAADFMDYAVFIGEARETGLYQNRYSTATAIFRRSMLTSLGYREELHSYEDWDLYQRAIFEGRRCIVSSSIEFLYRRRLDSMIHSADARSRVSVLYHDLLRGKRIQVGALHVPLSVLGSGSPPGLATEAQSVGMGKADLDAMIEELARYRNSRSIRITLALTRRLRRWMPWLGPLVLRGYRSLQRLRRR